MVNLKFMKKMLFNPPNFLFSPFHSLYFFVIFFHPKVYFVHFLTFGFKRWEKNSLKNSEGEKKLSVIFISTTKKNDFCANKFLFSIEI